MGVTESLPRQTHNIETQPSEMSVRRTANGCPVAEKKKRENLDKDFRGAPKLCVAAIDFGTTHCSVHYVLRPGATDPLLVDLELEPKCYRVPNSILFNQHGILMAFGNMALEQYISMPDLQRQQSRYFEHVKRHLQRNKSVSRETTVFADNKEEFLLVDVIAHTLHYLKTKLMESLDLKGYQSTKPADIDWVITVPAIWEARGKQMMREAGYKAGLCSTSKEMLVMPKLLPANKTSSDPFADVESPEQLSLALEPECAAIYLKKEIKKSALADQSGCFQGMSKCYIVADIGGGTVDIACHTLVGDGVEELCSPIGNNFGSVTVNEEFQRFLGSLVNDQEFASYIEKGKTESQQIKNKALVRKIVHRNFEQEKTRFSSSTDSTVYYSVELPGSFWKQYEDILVTKVNEMNQRGEMGIQLDIDAIKLLITAEQMSKFFEPTIQEISKLLCSLLSEESCKEIDTIYWVGGFGRSMYLQSKVKGEIEQKFGSGRCKFVTATHPGTAVVCGATAFRCNPSIIHSRKVDATYGTHCNSTFDPKIHNPTYKVWNVHRKQDRCKNLFLTFVEEGESVQGGDVFVTALCPENPNQTSMSIPIYSSPKKDVWYSTDPTVRKLGQVSVSMDGEGIGREVEIVFDVTHTEVQVRAYQKPSGREFKTVVDLLAPA